MAENEIGNSNSTVKKKSRIRLIILLIILVVAICIALLRLTSLGTRLRSSSLEEAPTFNQNSNSNILIAYFTTAENSDVDVVASASVTVVDGVAKGNLRAVADKIAEETGGDLYSIQTDFKYPSKYKLLIDHADKEQKDGVLPTLINPIENMDKYDVVFIDYPTWWYDMPQAMYSFFEMYDLSGKTIILFNSAQGSAFSGTEDTIKNLEPNATVIDDGISIYGGNYSEKDVEEWLERVGY